MRLLLAALALAGCQTDPLPAPTDDSAIAFPQSDPREVQMDALAEGTLVLDGRCLRLVTDGTEGDLARGFLVVWPPRVRLDTTGGAVRVVDDGSSLTAPVGGRVSLGGGAGPESPTWLVPPMCPGPFWIASGLVSGTQAAQDAGPLPLDLARPDSPPVDDLGFSMHRLGGDGRKGAFVEGGTPYVDADLVADALGVPRLASAAGDGVRDRGGRRYVGPDVVRREADAFVWYRPGDGHVRVYPADVLAGVVAGSELGRAAQAAGFEVFTGNPY